MDLETENRIASILLKEAAELRRQAEQEGVLAYLRKPTVRGRPNSRFLSATVRSVQQANRAVEVNEMWRVRQKELELDDRLKGRPRDDDNNGSRNRSKSHDSHPSSSSSKRVYEDHLHSGEAKGLRDEEVEEFLHSRVKRGRGSIGSRMDETGPYLPSSSEPHDDHHTRDERHHRVVLGPEKPSFPKPRESSESSDEDKRKRSKKASSEKTHSRKHKSKEKSRNKKKKEKRHKH